MSTEDEKDSAKAACYTRNQPRIEPIMNEDAVLELNRLLWQQERLLCGNPDPDVVMVDPGTYDPDTQTFKGAEVHIRGMLSRGTVFFTRPDTETLYSNDAILQVVSRKANHIYLDRGREIYQLVVTPPADAMDYYMKIRSGSETPGKTLCGDYLSSLQSVELVHFLGRLFMDRSDRKYSEMIELWEEGQRDWNYVLYVALFAAMGGSQYKKIYTKLAKTVPYMAIAHEKGSRTAVEALLLGGSGLLQLRSNDDYIIGLKKDFDYLCRKYNIMPMEAGEWDLKNQNNNRSPVLRLVQIGGFLSTREFIFDSVKNCRTPQDIYRLFRAEIPDYWTEQFAVSGKANPSGRIGTDKMDVLGINLVVPLLFSYASTTRDEQLREAAQDLIEKIDPESNAKIKLWRRRGVKMQNACDSQAILELNNEYCNKIKCYLCPVCKRLMNRFTHQMIK